MRAAFALTYSIEVSQHVTMTPRRRSRLKRRPRQVPNLGRERPQPDRCMRWVVLLAIVGAALGSEAATIINGPSVWNLTQGAWLSLLALLVQRLF